MLGCRCTAKGFSLHRAEHWGASVPSYLFLLKSGELHPLLSPAARGAVCVIAVSEEQANVSPSWGAWVKF